jgi:hypothetical protein
VTPIVAREDPSLGARVRSRRALFYAEGALEAHDRPAHVRAGSGLAWLGQHLVVVQDDASFLAVVDPRDATARAVPLPAGPGGARQFDDTRGTKQWKLDLEACVALDGVLLAFGSGSTAQREQIVVARGLEGLAPTLDVVSAGGLYAALRAEVAFAGSELNLEGAAALGDDVVLVQRGNGAPRGGLTPVDATCRVDRAALLSYLADPTSGPPPLREVTPADLGAIDGVRLTFTDAAAGPDGALWFLAAAEASADTYHDGVVVGVALGIIDRTGAARWTRLLDEAGGPLLDKAEGLALEDGHAWIVLDKDDPLAPSELCRVELSPPPR